MKLSHMLYQMRNRTILNQTKFNHKQINYAIFITVAILVQCGLIFTAGCGSSGSLEETASISLSVDSESVSADGKSSAAITAVFLDSAGAPVSSYTSITFTTNLGTFRNGSQTITVSTSDDSGTVTVSLISPTEPGAAEVSCASSGVTQLIQVNFSKTASIELSSDLTTVPADGAQSVKITAAVTEANGEPVVQNTEVSFTTTTGSFSNGLQTYSAVTIDDSGTVSVSLIAPTTPGIADVVCSSSGVTQSIRITFTHYDNSGPPVGEAFSLALEYHNISGLWVSGLSDTITAYLADINGNTVQDGVSVAFKTYNTGGALDPDVAVTGGVNSDDTTSASGTAKTTLYSTGEPKPTEGMVSVTAETDGGTTTHITSIAVTPDSDSNIIYAGTNGGGVYKSTDSGRNWTNISKSSSTSGQNWIEPYIQGNSAICVDPDDHNTVYVGTGYNGSGNLFRSLDGGRNWNSNNTEEWFGLYSTTGAVLTVLCDDGGSDYVWMGTEGKGILYADDGENFSPAGGVITVATPSGRGTIESAKLGYSATKETWTLTCIVPDATVNSYSSITDIDPIAVEDDSDTPVPVLNSTSTPSPDGTIKNFITSTNTKTEDWTVTYVVGTTADVTMLSVPKGAVTNVVPKQFEKEETWTLTCTYVDINDDQLLDGTSTIFSVVGSVSGTLEDANLNTSYSSDFIDFKIIAGSVPFIVGDIVQFKTVPKIDQPYWQVKGSVSGMQQKIATNNVAYTSDNGEIGFTIYEGNIAFTAGDYFTFTTYEARPTYWTVSGSVSGMQAGIAQTDQIYQSDNEEISFIIKESSSEFRDGDRIIIDVTPSSIGHGWTVTDIIKQPDTHGESAVLYAGTSTGLYKSSNGGKTWDSTGRFTGDSITCLELYHNTSSNTDVLYAGTQNGAVWVSNDSGSTWTQYATGMDRGTNIKDILLDKYNQTIYTIGWYGTSESATGKIFAHSLNADFTMTPEAAWYETNEGLSGSALYSIAADNRESASELYAGGEGINFYRSSGIVSSEFPIWEESATGLTNTIMARIPVLFSGEVSLSYKYVRYDNIVFLSIYLQDVNGNPPIAGSTFNVTYHDDTADEDYELTNIDSYPDAYTYQGTYRDPSNGYTNNPYQYTVQVASGDEITITYMLKCNDGESGCSGGGGEEKVTFSF